MRLSTSSVSLPLLDLSSVERLYIRVQGVVQGVGFRPFVYRLATELGLYGWVKNSYQGVEIELEGERQKLEQFLQHLPLERPPHSQLQGLETSWLRAIGYCRFEIRASESASCHHPSALILPDLATCSDCLRELFDPNDRRYRYPFINCTHCGPRFSILKALPYDRPHTTMAGFTLCPACQSEYEDPRHRRFHAQPNACPICGPQLALWDRQGTIVATRQDALLAAAQAIRQGQVVAVKGLGGFHLMVDACKDDAVQTLRQRKCRPDKPLAVMYPTLEQVQRDCLVSGVEAQVLQSSEAPIVLLQQRPITPIAPTVVGSNPYLGVLLPATPLHHLLMAELGIPVVATSGNRSHEPICIDEQEALQCLGTIADLFLVHDRPIARPVDDAIVQVVDDQPIVLRRARGYAPHPFQHSLSVPTPPVILAVGAHLKNTVAIGLQQQIFLSQHLGDLDNTAATTRFHEAMTQLLGIYHQHPTVIACDAHPDYYSTQAAERLQLQQLGEQPIALLPIQHHYAHVLSCLLDQGWQPPVLGIAWDGTGYGLDGTLWGGEFLTIPLAFVEPGFERVGHLRPFRLPGGDVAMREPRRSALGILYACLGEAVFEQLESASLQAFTAAELRLLKPMLQQGINSPWTSSAGRLFDAIASLLNLCQRSSFEGQAAMQVEFAASTVITDATYPISTAQSAIWDWQPMILALLDDLRDRVPIPVIAAMVHNTLVEVMVKMAQQVSWEQVVLTGGCFQNRYLLQRSRQKLEAAGFSVAYHHRIPTNDGGIAAGQIVGALRYLKQIN